MSAPRHSASSSMAAAAMPLEELERWLQARVDRRPVATDVPMLDGYVTAIEPPRVCRRPFRLSHAAMAGCSSMA